MCKKFAQIATNYTFLKAPVPANSNVQKHLQNFLNLNVYSRKTEIVQILFKGVCAKICANFLCKYCAICLLLL